MLRMESIRRRLQCPGAPACNSLNVSKAT